MVYRLVCIRENKRRDNTGIMEAFEHAYEDDVTDKKVRSCSRKCSKTSILTLRICRILNSDTYTSITCGNP